MKKYLLFEVAFITLLVSCGKDRSMNGVYCFEDDKEINSFFDYGRRIRCATIGCIAFKDGKCYVMNGGVEKRMDYTKEGNEIYVKNDDGTEDVIKIIDNNTIIVAGCTFKKDKNN